MIGGNAPLRRAEEFDAAVSGRAQGTPSERYAELLDVVETMRSVPQPVARAEFVADLRSQLMAAAAEMPVPARVTDDATALRLTPRQKRGSRERRMAALLGGFAVVAASGSMAVASQNALPGDTLYPVKRAIENAHANLESSPQAKASVLLDNATTRLAEVEALSARGDGDAADISSTLQAFKDQTSQAGSIAIDTFNSDGNDSALTAVRTFATASMDRLGALDDALPVESRPALVAAAQTVQSIDQAAYDACPTCTDGLVTQLPSFATQPLSSHLKTPLVAAITKSGKKSSSTPAKQASTAPSDASSPSGQQTQDQAILPPLLPSAQPTATGTHHGIVTGTLDQITKDLLGTPNSTPTTTTSGGDTSVVKSLTGLLGLG